jgi:hypothetical protein
VRDSDVQLPPGPLSQLIIPESALRNTITGLSYAAGREMLCYWIGVELSPTSESPTGLVTTVAFPRVESSSASFRLVEGQMGLITSWCAEHRMWVLAQVHTHPTDEPHSEADECWPASQRSGFLSVVFPYFASMSSIRNPGWRVYESRGGGNWIQLAPEDKFRIVPDVWFPNSGICE